MQKSAYALILAMIAANSAVAWRGFGQAARLIPDPIQTLPANSVKICNDFVPRQTLIMPYTQSMATSTIERQNDLPDLINDIKTSNIERAYDQEYLLKAAQYYIDNGSPEKAQTLAMKAHQLDDKDTTAIFLIGISYDYLSNKEKALEYYLKAEKIDTRLPGVHNNIGWIYLQTEKNNLEKAKKEFELEILYNPGDWNPYVNMAVIYRNNSDNEAAFQAYQKAVELAGDELEPLLIITRFCEQAQIHVEQGKRYLEKTLRLYPDSWRAWEIKAGFYYRDARYDEAEAAYLHSLKLYTRPTTLYELCWTYVKNNNLDLAKEAYDRAKTLDPEEDTCYENTAREFLEEKGTLIKNNSKQP